MSGKVISAVQRVDIPYAAPACEYVAIPDGSSSLAPVIRPGPRIFQNFNNLFGTLFFFIIY
jgi:hypothetical protein